MTEQYTRPKTVRFRIETWDLIEKDASENGVTTSEFIRALVASHVEVL